MQEFLKVTTFVVTGLLLIVLSVGQIVWMVHTHIKFVECNRQWHVAESQWNAAHARGDTVGEKAAFQNELLYFDAESLASADMFILPLRWRERWHVNYVEEARKTP